MQMSVFLALVQTLIGAATLGVALLALNSGDPPHSDGSPSKKARTRHPRRRDVLAASQPLGAKFSRRGHCSTLSHRFTGSSFLQH